MRKLNKLIAAILMLQGLFGLYKSIKFITLEGQKTSNIGEGDLKQYLNSEIITLIGIAISMLFAVKLSTGHKQRHQLLQNLIGIALIFANGFLFQWLNSLPILERFLSLIGL